MCLLGIQFQALADVPVLLLANREESYARPATPPVLHPPPRAGGLAWFGGTDLAAGGTWLGVNNRKLIVAVTNRRMGRVVVAQRSRGQLCLDLLQHPDAASACEAAVAELRRVTYAGCNLLLVSPAAAIVIEHADELHVHALPPGLHLVSNGEWNSPADDRLNFARGELEQVPLKPVENWLSAAAQLCGRRASGSNPAICLEGALGGTVSATVIALATTAEASHYRHAQGPPSTTPFLDHSKPFRDIFR